jgi:hypothetical protein
VFLLRLRPRVVVVPQHFRASDHLPHDFFIGVVVWVGGQLVVR